MAYYRLYSRIARKPHFFKSQIGSICLYLWENQMNHLKRATVRNGCSKQYLAYPMGVNLGDDG